MVKSQRVTRSSGKGQRAIKKLLTWQKTAAVLSAAVGGVVGLLMQGNQAQAAVTTYDWAPSPSTNGQPSFGNGSWDTTAANKIWTIDSTGTNIVAWANLTAVNDGPCNNAIFGGIQNGAATVTIDSYVNVGNMTFNTAGYTITAANGYYLDGQNGTNATTITTNANATINCVYDDLANNYTGAFGSLTQVGAGTLTFGNGALQYWGGAMTVNGSGTNGGVTLSGSNNNPQFHYSNTNFNNGLGNLTLNGGTLDLQGNTPVFGSLSNTSTAGGLLTSTTEAGTNFTTVTFRTGTASTSSFNGTIAGNLNVVFESTGSTQTLAAANTFGGSLGVYGGTVSLAGLGQALNASALHVEAGWLTLDNTLSDVTNRLSSSAPLSLTTGTINLLGNASSLISQQSFGTATLSGGYNLINVTPGGTTGAASVTFANVNYAMSNHAGLTFTGANLGLNTANTVTNSANIALTQINGAAPTNSLSNGILPSNWLVINGANTDFAALAPDNQNVTAYTGYTVENNLASFNPGSSANVLVSGTTAVSLTSNITINSLNLGQGYTKTTFAGAHTMTLGAGGLIINSAANFTPAISVITAGTSSSAAELNVWFNSAQSSGLWYSQLTDNSNGGSVTFVKSGPGQMDLYQPANRFSYTGGTIINQGTILVNDNRQTSTSTASCLPGQITINKGATLNYNQAFESIGSNANSWVINDGGTVTVGTGSEYCAGITFNNNGGNQAPIINLGTGGTKSIFLQGNITSYNNSLTTVPTISGGGTNPDLDMGGVTRTFDVEGSAPNGLTTTDNVVNGSIIKTGPGGWVLNSENNGINSSLTGLEVQQGAIITFDTVSRLLGQSTVITLDNAGSWWAQTGTGGNGTNGTLAFNGGTLADASINTSNGRGSQVIVGQNIIVGQNASGGATTNGGSVLEYDALEKTYYQNLVLSGNISGSNTLNVTGTPFIAPNSGSVTLTGTNSTFAGTYNVTQNGNLTSQNATDTGSSLGSTNAGAVNVALVGASLTINDNAASNTNGISNQLLNYGANISVTTASAPFTTNTLTVNRQSGTATANTIILNNLTLNSNPTLTVSNGNSYAVQFQGLISGGGTLAGTGPVTLTGNGIVSPGGNVNTGTPAILNVTNTTFALNNGTSVAYAPVVNGASAGWTGSNSTGAGVSNDQINMVAATGLKINGATLDVLISNTASLQTGQKFFLVNETVAPTGSPTNFAQVEFNGTLESSIGTDGTDGALEYSDPNNSFITYEVDYAGNITTGALTGGQDVVLDVVGVPEPASLSLIGLGALSLLTARRPRRKPRTAD